jgi:hypothetical protein
MKVWNTHTSIVGWQIDFCVYAITSNFLLTTSYLFFVSVNNTRTVALLFSGFLLEQKSFHRFIFLFPSKIKLLKQNINIFFRENYVEKFSKYFWVFIGILSSKQIVPTSLFSFPLMNSKKKICRNFHVILLCNPPSDNVCIALEKTQNAENQKP